MAPLSWQVKGWAPLTSARLARSDLPSSPTPPCSSSGSCLCWVLTGLECLLLGAPGSSTLAPPSPWPARA